MELAFMTSKFGYFILLITQTNFQGHLEFEIMGVDCTTYLAWMNSWVF